MPPDDCDLLTIRPSTHAQSVGKASWQYAVSRPWDRSCWCLVLHPSQKGRVICTTALRFSSCSIHPPVFQSTNPYLSHTLRTHFHQASDDRYPYNMYRQHIRRNICRGHISPMVNPKWQILVPTIYHDVKTYTAKVVDKSGIPTSVSSSRTFAPQITRPFLISGNTRDILQNTHVR